MCSNVNVTTRPVLHRPSGPTSWIETLETPSRSNAIEANAWPLMRRGVHPHIGDVVEPLASLLIEIGIIGKCAAVGEIVAEVAHGPLDLALGLGAIGPTRARCEAPAVREAEKLALRTSARLAAADHA